MDVRYSRPWALTTPLGRALKHLCGWPMAAPRLPGFGPHVVEGIPEGERGGSDIYFASIMYQIAHDLWAKYDELVVLWSGGTDSTLIVSLLLATKPINSTLAIATDEATYEAADSTLLEYLLSHGVVKTIAAYESLRAVTADRNGMVVTGWHADVLLGGEMVRYLDAYETIWDMSEQDAFVNYGKLRGLATAQCLEMYADLEPLLATNPFERTAANSTWWLDYITTWSEDEQAMQFGMKLNPPGVGYINFYNHDDLQRWSIQPVEDKVGKTALTHKRIYKSLIEEILGFAPNLPMGTVANDSFGNKADLNRILVIKQDWSVVRTTR